MTKSLQAHVENFEIVAVYDYCRAAELRNAAKVATDPVTPAMMESVGKVERDLRAAMELVAETRRLLDARAIDAMARVMA